MTKLFLWLIAATYFNTPKCPQGYQNAHVSGCAAPTVVGRLHTQSGEYTYLVDNVSEAKN